MNPALLALFGRAFTIGGSESIIGASFLPKIDSSVIPTDYELSEFFDATMSFLTDYTLNGILAKTLVELPNLLEVKEASENFVAEIDNEVVVNNDTTQNAVGTTLPELLKNSAIGNVSALGTHTKAITKGFSDLNVTLLGITSLMQESIRLKAVELSSGTVSGGTTVSVQSAVPAINVASAVPAINVASAVPAINVSSTAPTVNVASAVPAINVSSTAPTVNVASAVPDITVQSAVPDITVNPELALPSSLEGNLNDVLGLQKQSIPKQITKDDLKIESLEYTKTDKSITDLDGKVMATVSPREVANIKNVSDARWITDSNELEMEDDELDIMDLVGNIDFSDLMNHTDYGTKISEIFTTASSNE